MKSVLISIKPKWVEKICNGSKTIEVRKTRPKIETPFKCYIYETKDKKYENMGVMGYRKDGTSYNFVNHIGKVIGEFTCDNVIQWNYKRFITMTGSNDTYFPFRDDLKSTCLTYEEIENYGKGKTLYGWHISNLKIYDKPRELSEFWTIKCTNKRNGCQDCKEKPNCIKTITRPPQSWCYVKEN